MSVCTNLPRLNVCLWNRKVDPETECWISIGEPGLADTVVNNITLDKIPNLKIDFWDIVEPLASFIPEDPPFLPPLKEDAAKIIDFILENKGRNFLINCQAGISRSGAICKFLEDNLGYEWDKEGKTRTYKKHGPNKLLVGLLAENFNERTKKIQP